MHLFICIQNERVEESSSYINNHPHQDWIFYWSRNGSRDSFQLTLKAPITQQILWHLSQFFTKIRYDITWESSACLICYFWKSSKICNCRLPQIIGGALRVNSGYPQLFATCKNFHACLLSADFFQNQLAKAAWSRTALFAKAFKASLSIHSVSFDFNSNTPRLYSQWLNSVIYWLINHCTDWARTGVTSFGRQFDFHDVIYHNRRRNVYFTTSGRSKRT